MSSAGVGCLRRVRANAMRRLLSSRRLSLRENGFHGEVL